MDKTSKGTLYFKRSNGERVKLEDNLTMETAMKPIKKFIDDHNYKSYYTRVWQREDEIWYDVGSYTEFFILKLYDTQYKINKKEQKSMNITIERKDLFTIPQGYYLAHCISGDFALGAGIAKTFDNVYNMRSKLFKKYNNYTYTRGTALIIDNVFNLVTKDKYWHKPTYQSVEEALEMMRDQCVHLDITKLAMPKIASGLDKLSWDKVYEIICEVFEDTDIEIVICEL